MEENHNNVTVPKVVNCRINNSVLISTAIMSQKWLALTQVIFAKHVGSSQLKNHMFRCFVAIRWSVPLSVETVLISAQIKYLCIEATGLQVNLSCSQVYSTTRWSLTVLHVSLVFFFSMLAMVFGCAAEVPALVVVHI